MWAFWMETSWILSHSGDKLFHCFSITVEFLHCLKLINLPTSWALFQSHSITSSKGFIFTSLKLQQHFCWKINSASLLCLTLLVFFFLFCCAIETSTPSPKKMSMRTTGWWVSPSASHFSALVVNDLKIRGWLTLTFKLGSRVYSAAVNSSDVLMFPWS